MRVLMLARQMAIAKLDQARKWMRPDSDEHWELLYELRYARTVLHACDDDSHCAPQQRMGGAGRL